MGAKAKAAWQTPLLGWKSDVHCPYNRRLLKNEEYKDQKDSETKKNDTPATNNNSENSG